MEKNANNYYGILQHPTGSGFDAATTAMQVVRGIDLKGKTAIVTGGYSGIGKETVKALVWAGATVIVPARDVKKAESNLSEFTNIEIEEMDLMDSASIDAFVFKFIASGRPLHILINNAGIMWPPLRRDGRGNESQFSTNHLGHFQLTALLWPALKQASGARVVNVSSLGHKMGSLDLEDPNFETRPYEPYSAYANSKKANILFSLELDKRASHYGVRSYSLHPGNIGDTDLNRDVPKETLAAFGLYDENGNVRHDPYNGFKSSSEGASTTVWCAVSPELENIGGVYCDNSDIAPLDIEWNGFDPQNLSYIGVTRDAVDPENAQKLWTLSEKLIGIEFIIE